MVELNKFRVDYGKIKKSSQKSRSFKRFLIFIQHIFGSVIEISTENSFFDKHIRMYLLLASMFFTRKNI